MTPTQAWGLVALALIATAIAAAVDHWLHR